MQTPPQMISGPRPTEPVTHAHLTKTWLEGEKNFQRTSQSCSVEEGCPPVTGTYTGLGSFQSLHCNWILKISCKNTNRCKNQPFPCLCGHDAALHADKCYPGHGDPRNYHLQSWALQHTVRSVADPGTESSSDSQPCALNTRPPCLSVWAASCCYNLCISLSYTVNCLGEGHHHLYGCKVFALCKQ